MNPFSNEYHFVTHWRFQAPADVLYSRIHQVLDYPNWWHGPQLKVTELQKGEPSGKNSIAQFEMKGFLPYKMRWALKCTVAENPGRIEGISSGDFAGIAIWTFDQKKNFTEVTFDWRIRAEHPLLKNFSFFLRPIFILHHHWVMATWEKSLGRTIQAGME